MMRCVQIREAEEAVAAAIQKGLALEEEAKEEEEVTYIRSTKHTNKGMCSTDTGRPNLQSVNAKPIFFDHPVQVPEKEGVIKALSSCVSLVFKFYERV